MNSIVVGFQDAGSYFITFRYSFSAFLNNYMDGHINAICRWPGIYLY